MPIDDKYVFLLNRLKSLGSAVLAYSGGVDSTFLLCALKNSGIEKILAVTASSPSVPADDLKTASAMAAEMNVEHLVVESAEMSDENYLKNPTDRCFYCKSGLFKKLSEIANEKGFSHLLDGSTADDAGDYRPGLKAREKHGVLSPLMEAGLGKAEIRALSRLKNLATWDRPASPCLSSRLPYGERITPEALSMIEQAECALKALGFRELRVRKSGDTARIEVPADEISRFMDNGVRVGIVDKLRAIGFLYVTLDLEGFKSGKLNRVIDGGRGTRS